MNHFYFNYTKVKVCQSWKCTSPLWLIRGAMILNFYNYLVLHPGGHQPHFSLSQKMDELWKNIRFSVYVEI